MSLSFQKDFLNEEATFELNKSVEIKNKLITDDLIDKTDNQKKDKAYHFQKFKQYNLLEDKFITIVIIKIITIITR